MVEIELKFARQHLGGHRLADAARAVEQGAEAEAPLRLRGEAPLVVDGGALTQLGGDGAQRRPSAARAARDRPMSDSDSMRWASPSSALRRRRRQNVHRLAPRSSPGFAAARARAARRRWRGSPGR